MVAAVGIFVLVVGIGASATGQIVSVMALRAALSTAACELFYSKDIDTITAR